MEAVIYGLTDAFHLLKILFFCDLIFMFHKRKENRFGYIVSFCIILILSICFYSIDASAVTFSIYAIALCIVVCLIYDERLYELFFAGLWILFLTSMLDVMLTELVNVVFEICNQNSERVEELIAAVASLLFILILGKIYREKYNFAIIKIGFIKLFLFSVLAMADAFVVVIITAVLINEYTGNHRLLYFISVIIVIIGIFIQLASVILLIISRDTYKEKQEITKKYLNEQTSHYKYLEQREKDTKKFRHDIKSHMQVLSALARNKKYFEFDEYMAEINIRIDNFGSHITVNNGIVDAIINRYYSEALNKGIDISITGMFPNTCRISPYDLCTIFSNLLSNAIEAAEKSVEKKISMECRYTEDNIVVITKNTFEDKGQFRHSKIVTTKENIEYHGFGIENIKEAVEHNNGMLDIEIKDTTFSITIMLGN